MRVACAATGVHGGCLAYIATEGHAGVRGLILAWSVC